MPSRIAGTIVTTFIVASLSAVTLLAVLGESRLSSVLPAWRDPAEEQATSRPEADLGQSAHHVPEDLFAPLENEGRSRVQADDSSSPKREKGTSKGAWNDPFNESAQTAKTEGSDSTKTAGVEWDPPPIALNGWQREKDSHSPQPDSESSSAADSSPKRFRQSPDSQANGNPSSSGSSGQPLTWRGAVRRLNALGIHEYQLRPGVHKNAFLFRCRFTPKDNPRTSILFEDEANDPLRAVEKVLAQIEQRLAKR